VGPLCLSAQFSLPVPSVGFPGSKWYVLLSVKAPLGIHVPSLFRIAICPGNEPMLQVCCAEAEISGNPCFSVIGSVVSDVVVIIAVDFDYCGFFARLYYCWMC
jgi:hypothetical protein